MPNVLTSSQLAGNWFIVPMVRHPRMGWFTLLRLWMLYASMDVIFAARHPQQGSVCQRGLESAPLQIVHFRDSLRVSRSAKHMEQIGLHGFYCSVQKSNGDLSLSLFYATHAFNIYSHQHRDPSTRPTRAPRFEPTK